MSEEELWNELFIFDAAQDVLVDTTTSRHTFRLQGTSHSGGIFTGGARVFFGPIFMGILVGSISSVVVEIYICGCSRSSIFKLGLLVRNST